MKLQPKIALILVASMLTAIVLSFVIINVSIAVFDRSYSWYDLDKIAMEAARDLSAAPALDADTASATIGIWKTRYPDLFFSVFDDKRTLLYPSDERPRRRPRMIEEIRRRMEEDERRVAASGGSLRFVDTIDRSPYMVMKRVVTTDQVRGTLSVAVRPDSFLPFYIRVNDEKVVDSYLILLGALASIIALSFLLVVLLTSPLIRRLRALYIGINNFELGRPVPPEPAPGRDEIGIIRQTFSRMAERIHADYEERVRIYKDRQELLRNISHDFRTPLTSILGYAASLEEGMYDSAEEQRTYYTIIRKKAEYMTKLFNEMMELTRLDSDSLVLKRAEFNLGELAREILIEYLPQIERAGMTVETGLPEILPVTGDRERISRALRNLLDNVVTHAASGKYLGVFLRGETHDARPGVVLEVIDHGPGVSEADRPKIFDRFYSVSGNGEGSGLGLAIAREIVEKHNGTIDLAESAGPGSVFRVFLPV
jgi:signal transduction histidine kinase